MDDYFTEVETRIGALVEQGAHRHARAVRLPRLPVASLAVAASTLAAVVIAAVALLTVHHVSAPSTPTAPAGRQAGIDPILLRDFKLLRRPVAASDRLPGHLPNLPDARRIGLLPRLARRVRLSSVDHLSAWLIPGRRGACWFTEAALSTPYRAVCVGPPMSTGRALVAGSGTDVEDTLADGIVGLVTDRVRAIELDEGQRFVRFVSLEDGFYVSPVPTGHERLVAVTRSGHELLYPQPVSEEHFGIAHRVIPRASRPRLVADGPRGMRVTVVYEMTCWRTGSDDIGSTSPRIGVRLPADIQLFFPTGSRTRRSCNVAATVTAASNPRVQVRAAIVLR